VTHLAKAMRANDTRAEQPTEREEDQREGARIELSAPVAISG
jgi:hypothetical protein